MGRSGKAPKGGAEASGKPSGGAGGGSSDRARLPSRPMNLKGVSPSDVVGRCVTVLYDEGEPKPTPYQGCVVYAEPSRLWVGFHGFDEADSAWIDDSDEWSWAPTPAAGVPPAPPVPGAYRPGLVPGPIDKIFLARTMADSDELELFIKWKGLAHVHSQWVPRAALDLDPSNRQRVSRFLKALAAEQMAGLEATWEIDAGDGGDREGGARTEDEPYNPDFNIVERVIAEQSSGDDDTPPLFLVKWRGLPYVNCTWESTRTLLHDQSAIRSFRAREATPSAHERRIAASAARPPRNSFRKLEQSPVFKSEHTLRPYQLEGLNWLLFSWYTRRSVMLADEMGLGKTVQSVSTLNHIWKEEGIRGPFLVLAPLSTLSHWQREFEGWTDMNTIVYHGSNESRELIRAYEFFYADAHLNPQTRGLYKFQTLITSYEVVKQDLAELRRIPWRYLVVDEAHRLKNKDSALANDLRTLQVEHLHLLSGTPLQNNTTELWALLNILDSQLFPSLELFIRDFGTLTDSAQVDRLNEKIRPYLLRRQKGDVEKSLVPLDETIIWVELTLFQKKCYKAILEGNRDILIAGATSAALPSLVNIQMELRKCCNHPYLIKGVAESNTKDVVQEEQLGSLLRASGKFVLLDKLLPKLRREGHRVLIFSQMVKMLDMLSDYLRERRYSHERLDGTVRGDLRQAAIDRFSKPGSDTFIFLLSTRAGGLGINLTAADTCIIFDSDWNPQNDVQAMARSHRIGQSRKVKVFRLVTRNTYESEMVERANKKLGLERAMNADRANDGLKDGKHGPPQDRTEIDAMLKRGAHDIFINEGDDAAFQKFSEADIDEILESSSTRISYEQSDASGSVFSRAAFVADDNAVDMDDPEFWTKILPELEQKDAALAEYFLKRKSKQVKRFGMAEDFEADEFLEEGKGKKSSKGSKNREEDDAKRAARRALAHVWSKTERMNCERALLSFGFGRWGRVKELAQGGTKMRSEAEVASFGVAFVCLCLGLPIGSVGAAVPSAEEEQRGIQRAREILAQMGCALPSLSSAEMEELEPLVSAGGTEYAERVHKLGASFLQRLLFLKRLADAVERDAKPLETYRAPVVRGGVGREMDVPWTPRDDAMLLLGVYKHGYRAYEEVRDDPELIFSCRSAGPALPPPLPQPAVSNSGAIAAFDEMDVLPVPPASCATPARPAAAHTRPPCFLQEKEYRERVKALLDALADEATKADEVAAWEAEFEEEHARELRGEPSRPAKTARREADASPGSSWFVDVPSNREGAVKRAAAQMTMEDELRKLWAGEAGEQFGLL
ncbi:hypothetical protein AB1Y20_003620 [Prymnesium parvum]|uniref:Uncharacterized protein n=1 Tax=Prymnesium parvum TaxID=97485 RepID=A0AB34J553_PRYPA